MQDQKNLNCEDDKNPSAETVEDQAPSGEETLVSVYENAPEGYDGSCLRPMGLCDLGGCCDACWYSPDHPRFQKTGE